LRYGLDCAVIVSEPHRLRRLIRALNVVGNEGLVWNSIPVRVSFAWNSGTFLKTLSY
jgi:hypothetical protein